jgi:hypothetical protein
MMYPPSLPEDVKARAFLATNGELGILPADASSFLSACRADGVKALGWELWLVHHAWGEDGAPIAAAGLWCGGIPVRSETIPAVIGGTGNADETERQLIVSELSAEVKPDWLPHVRINFTLAN